MLVQVLRDNFWFERKHLGIVKVDNPPHPLHVGVPKDFYPCEMFEQALLRDAKERLVDAEVMAFGMREGHGFVKGTHLGFQSPEEVAIAARFGVRGSDMQGLLQKRSEMVFEGFRCKYRIELIVVQYELISQGFCGAMKVVT
jgi:hypothetical protein